MNIDWATSETQRGFQEYVFKDSYGKAVTLRESSNIEPHIWIFPEIHHVGDTLLAGAHLTPEMALDVAARLTAWAKS
jgi:hypothetical protein